MSKSPLIYTVLWSDMLVVAQFRAREGDAGVWKWFYQTAEKLCLPLKMTTKPDDPKLVYRPPCIASICQELPPEVRETLNMSWFEFEFKRVFKIGDENAARTSRLYQWYQVLKGYDVDWWGGRVCKLSVGWELVRVRIPKDAVNPVPGYVKV